MGLLDTLDTLDLSDEVKAQIRSEHEAEVTPLSTQLADERREARRTQVEAEVESLKGMFSEAPGLLKFVRRVFLSDDAEPGLVLLSDGDLNLSDEQKTGARTQEDITVAGALREFIKLMPKKDDGTLALSDQALAANAGDTPDKGDEPDEAEKTAGARERLGKIAGHTGERTRSRYNGGRPAGGVS